MSGATHKATDNRRGPAAGSYDFDRFDPAELRRLELQAAAAGRLEQAVWQRAGLRPGMDVLDLACGPGAVTCALARYAAPGRVLGADLSETLLAAARRRAEAEALANVEFARADVYRPDLPAEGFDFVYARFLFQHLARPDEALAAVRPCLRPGGVLCILDVDDQFLLVEPELPELAEFTALAGQGQAAAGGDRHVGRRLPGLLHDAGLAEVRLELQPFSSYDAGLGPFLEITLGHKLAQAAAVDPDRAAHCLARIRALTAEPRAWGAAAVFVATGRG